MSDSILRFDPPRDTYTREYIIKTILRRSRWIKNDRDNNTFSTRYETPRPYSPPCMRLPGWPGWGDGPPGSAVPPARRLPCCPPPPPPPCCAAFIIFLYLLLLFWNQIFTCNKNRTRIRSGETRFASCQSGEYWRTRPKRRGGRGGERGVKTGVCTERGRA